MLLRLFKFEGEKAPEQVFTVDAPRGLSTLETVRLLKCLGDPQQPVRWQSAYPDSSVIEIGSRLSIESSFSSNATSIFAAIDVPAVRVERSFRYPLGQSDATAVTKQHLDVMTQQIYARAPGSFDLGIMPEPVRIIPFLRDGEQALREINSLLGLGMDERDLGYYAEIFHRLGRDPTDVELFQLGNGNSEHSRHWYFRGIHVIDGIVMPETLMDIVRAPLAANPRNSLVAFRDNAGVIKGTWVPVFMPENPGQPSAFKIVMLMQHITSTAETHNNPTMIAPFPGAETGSGGRIRDNRAVGRGGLEHVGLAGYMVGNLHLPEFKIPGEQIGGEVSQRHASPIDILIKGSNGISDYGNKIGEPLAGGFVRTFGQMVGGERYEARKPVLYTAGLGSLFEGNLNKRLADIGMLIVRIGGPAYRIGVGGGAASSITGTQDAALDLKSVQRGNAEMENRVNRVIQACAELLDRNPIESIHDQGAGGPSNLLTELMDPLGGKVDIRKIVAGDKTMSVLELWVAEYQEGYGLLVRPENLQVLQSICKNERVNCEVLGTITGDGKVVVVDSQDGSTSVDLPLKDILSEMPAKRFVADRKQVALPPLVIPSGLTVVEALQMIFRLPSVGSKGYLVRKVDRHVTGRIAQQQCCGPLHLPVADVVVKADSLFGYTGAATALGEQPIKMLINPRAGARMAVAEMLTNLASAKITSIKDVKCRANWMWAAKLPGEGPRLYDAAIAMRDIMLALGIAIDGGKDSLSMATDVNGGRAISPGQLVIKGYAPVPDVRHIVTPDLKGGDRLGFISFGPHNRLGGTAFAQALGQLGDESPDLDEEGFAKLGRAFGAIQELIGRGYITAYHDRSDGGLITAVAEMCISGNRGAQIYIRKDSDPFAELFSEEVGMVFEYRHTESEQVQEVLEARGVNFRLLGVVDSNEGGNLRIYAGNAKHLDASVTTLRQWWEAASDAFEMRQSNPETVAAERESYTNAKGIPYRLTFKPMSSRSLSNSRPHKVAVIREEGTNGDREMAAALYTAGLNPVDINMEHLLTKQVTSLDSFRGVVFPGGFSHADVLGSAKGWASVILHHPELEGMFRRFYDREDTFTFGVCNGCQLMANIGWLPYVGLPETSQPRLLHNLSGRFESRWAGVEIQESPAVLLEGMAGSTLGVWVAHGEGRFFFPDSRVLEDVKQKKLVSMAFVDPSGNATEAYPYNPNGSPEGIAALCSPDGRHLAMMPHPERCFIDWQLPYAPDAYRGTKASPWLQLFQNARRFCER